MIDVVVYFRRNAPDSEELIQELNEIQRLIPHRLILVDIDRDPQLKRVYGSDIPIVQVGPFSLRGKISRERLLIALGAAQDRTDQLDKLGQKRDGAESDKFSLKKSDRFSLWMSGHYLTVINVLLAIFIGGSFLAPVLMRAGAEGAAKVLYAIYSPFCHQLPFRSWFLFGGQAYYPRQLAEIPDVISYEEVSHSDGLDLFEARNYVGDAVFGYKTALCQRDIAIFSAMLVFGLYFGLTGKKTKPVRWYVLLLLGLLPMLIDGGSQLKGVLGDQLPAWLPVRESTPLLRTITGALFGFLTAWFILPYLEESAQMTQRILVRKKAVSEGMNADGRK